MASFSSTKKSLSHVRSISLPSRLNPHSVKIESELNKLKFWETSIVSTVHLNAETVKLGMVGLVDLYNCFEELVCSSLTQQALIQYQHGNIVEEALEGSVVLLDMCNMARDFLTMMKENERNLQLALRRKVDNLSIERSISAYMSSKNKMKKEIRKRDKALTRIENKIGAVTLLDVSPYLSMVIRVLREVASMTVSVLRFVFLFLSITYSRTKSCRWSLISKIMLTSPVTSEGDHQIINEVRHVDVAIQTLRECIRRKSVKIDTEIPRQRLEGLDRCLEELEGGLDCVFRSLVKNRVSLLNILVH